MQTQNNDFPCTPDELTLEYLNAALRNANCLDTGAVIAFESKLIGTGKMGDNARISLQYEGASAGAPADVVGKFPAADEQARSMAGAQGAYYNEVMFYRDLAPKTSMRTPVIYASEISEDRSRFLLLMEDMSPAEPGSQFVGESLEHCRWALQQAAKLAASFYGDDDLGARDYVMAAARDDGGAFAESLMIEYWPQFLDRFGHGLSADCIAFGEKQANNFSKFISRFQGPKTLAHGDFRSENILFSKSEATIVDWQTASESSALTDVAYFLGGSVELDNRREWERDLIEQYRIQLDQLGVSLSFQDCWDQYREFSMHGIMITVLGACFSAPAERSDKMFLAMIQRHLQQCIDLDAAEFLPS